MNHLFNLKFDQMRNNAPDKEGASESIIYYDGPSYDRKLCFVQLDGSRVRCNYAFLIDDEYYPDKEIIVLFFTSRKITLTGINLEMLHDELERNMPQKIYCMDERYNTLIEKDKPVVNKIEIENKV